MPNQHKPLPPETPKLRTLIEYYWRMKHNDRYILEQLKKHHIDLSRYGLEIKAFRKLQERMGFFRVRKQGHTVDSIMGPIARIRIVYPRASARDMVNLLFHEEDILVPRCRSVVIEYFFIPLVSQSDPGSENVGIANGHTTLCHLHDPDLAGTSQHRYMREKKNVMPEITWSMMRRRFTPGFEDILDTGVDNGWYDPGIVLKSLIFRWVFIPWLQAELEAYQKRVNMTAKRRDRNKILPHGVPQHMLEFPEEYAILDFKVKVNQAHIDTVREQYAPPAHDIFHLVPPDFAEYISRFYADLGSPPVTRQTCWDVYRQLLRCFEELDQLLGTAGPSVDQIWGFALTQAADQYCDEIQPIAGLRPLRGGEDVIGQDGAYYMGGVNAGAGLGLDHCAALEQLIDNVEPRINDNETDTDDDEEIFAWFSDEERPDAEPDEW
ncbi:unnamed protein product [Mycena citricolor]|uniref:Uncharacterized protein n=1 Tax=Mycena citricolor TaxID=2018698 RepID=A0AAD2Q1J9_9AGAR|nr:unnamed protein product [Mycena citricolor]